MITADMIALAAVELTVVGGILRTEYRITKVETNVEVALPDVRRRLDRLEEQDSPAPHARPQPVRSTAS